MTTTLQFREMTDGDCRFEVEDLEVREDGISFSDVTLFIGNRRYAEDRVTFSGSKWNSTDAFEVTINAFLRKDRNFRFSPEWEDTFEVIEEQTEYKGRIPVALPQIYFDDVVIYELQLMTEDDDRYYTYGGDMVMLLDRNGRISTDIENFFTDALYQDIADYLQGRNIKYISDETAEWIEEEGRDYFLED